MQMAQFSLAVRQSEQQFRMAERQQALAEKQAAAESKKASSSKGSKAGEKKPAIKMPSLPTPFSIPSIDPAIFTPTYLTGSLTANGKTGAPGARTSALTGAKRKAQGLGKRSNAGTATLPGLTKSKSN
jgi:hypothetical protein